MAVLLSSYGKTLISWVIFFVKVQPPVHRGIQATGEVESMITVGGFLIHRFLPYLIYDSPWKRASLSHRRDTYNESKPGNRNRVWSKGDSRNCEQAVGLVHRSFFFETSWGMRRELYRSFALLLLLSLSA